MAGGRVAHVTLKGPSVVRELCIGFALGLVAGSLWKMHHWNEQRKVRSFYDLLEKEASKLNEESKKRQIPAGIRDRILTEPSSVC
ncbi:cytochrome c oxidase subunit 5C [Populus alba x Populus x berolinensis]|nr:cytochrome c oxidase subunit 5C [Populus alba x Populus x berolinensis]